MTSFAYAYLNGDYTSVYVTLPKIEQLIFYWNKDTNEQRRAPKDRLTRTTYETARITALNNLGCVVEIDGRRAEFEWTEYSREDNNPAHKGRLVNFADWEYDPEFKPNTPTHEYQQPVYSGHYSEPQAYEEEE